MSSSKTERVSSLRSQAFLPFAGDVVSRAAASSAATAVVGQGVEPVPVPCVAPGLDPGEPDADLESMDGEQLRRTIGLLKTCRDRRPDVIVRLFKAIGILKSRGGLSPAAAARTGQVAAAPAVANVGGVSGPRPVKIRTALRSVNGAAGPELVERLARCVADELGDADSIRTFRLIAEGVRSGLVEPKTVLAAYRRAKEPGAENPGAIFTARVMQRSPEFARWCDARRRARRDAAVGDGARSGLPKGDL